MFRSLVCFLRKNLPAERPIRVRRTRVPNDVQGDCQQVSDGFRIRIDRELSEAHQIDVLLHEYGHTLTYEPQHGAAWGMAYARVYRTYLAWVEWFDRRQAAPRAAPYLAAAVARHRRRSSRQSRRSKPRVRRSA